MRFFITQSGGQNEAQISFKGIHDWCISPRKNDLGPCLQLEIAFIRGEHEALAQAIANLNSLGLAFTVDADEGVASITIEDLDQVWDEKVNEEETK